jgi:hypothetical protein
MDEYGPDDHAPATATAVAGTPWDDTLAALHALVDDADTAQDTMRAIGLRHGFWPTFVTRADVEHAYKRPLDDGEWDQIARSWAWTNRSWLPTDTIRRSLDLALDTVPADAPFLMPDLPAAIAEATDLASDPGVAVLFCEELSARFGLAVVRWRRSDVETLTGRNITPERWQVIHRSQTFLSDDFWPTAEIRSRLATLAAVDQGWPSP